MDIANWFGICTVNEGQYYMRLKVHEWYSLALSHSAEKYPLWKKPAMYKNCWNRQKFLSVPCASLLYRQGIVWYHTWCWKTDKLLGYVEESNSELSSTLYK